VPSRKATKPKRATKPRATPAPLTSDQRETLRRHLRLTIDRLNRLSGLMDDRDKYAAAASDPAWEHTAHYHLDRIDGVEREAHRFFGRSGDRFSTRIHAIADRQIEASDSLHSAVEAVVAYFNSGLLSRADESKCADEPDELKQVMHTLSHAMTWRSIKHPDVDANAFILCPWDDRVSRVVATMRDALEQDEKSLGATPTPQSRSFWVVAAFLSMKPTGVKAAFRAHETDTRIGRMTRELRHK